MPRRSSTRVWAGNATTSFIGISCRCKYTLMRQPTTSNATSETHPAAPAQPKRVLGFRDLVMFYVVATLSLRWIAVAASAGPSSIVIWFLGLTTIFIPLALCVMELSSRYPEEGGLYVWSKHAFGDFAGYISAWTYWTSNLPYFPAVLYFAASNALYIRPRHWTYLTDNARFYVWFSVIALVVITVLNLVGLNVGKWLHNAGALGMWLPVVIIVSMGFIGWHRFGAATRFTAASLVP